MTTPLVPPVPPAPQSNAVEITAVRSALEADYEVIEELGRGGMAVVYRAREKALDREVAIKVLPAALAFDAGFVERFEREAKTAGQLEHPNIVPIYRVGRSGTVIFFVMKFLRGQSLSVILRERPKLDVHEVRHILLETASALGYAAKRGVVHRDIKPDNILLDTEGHCVVTDFGIAKTASGPHTAAGTSMGTPRYMSPEHAQGTPVDGRSDIYSLGVVAYQCLVGTTPFDGDDPFAILYKHINTPIPQPELATDEERQLYAVIERMLAKRQEERFQSASELMAALGGQGTSTTLVSGVVTSLDSLVAPTQIMPTGPLARFRRLLQRRRLVWMTAAGGVAALALIAYFARPGTPPAADSALARPPAPVTGSPAGTKAVPAGVTPTAANPGAVTDTTPGAKTVAGTGSTAATTPRPAAARPAPQPPSKCPPQPRTFSVLVDTVRAQKEGTRLTFKYDVCGLQPSTAFSTDITVRRTRQPRFSGIRGKIDPVTLRVLEVAASPRYRRSRQIDISKLPAGPYALDVLITDAKNRQQQKSREFDILEKK
ncbi:MAG TPA: serine/threonine-protein kinase [Gemmatimonadaceae bacterium]